MEAVAALNRIILALVLVSSFGLHQAMQCQGASAVSAASDHCSHALDSCPRRSTPHSPVKSCCANSACLSYSQCSVEETAITKASVAPLQSVSGCVSVFPSPAAARSPRLALRFHSPPAQVPFFVAHHAFLI